MADAPDERPWMAHLRGVLVAGHILAVLLLATPDLTGALNRKSWKSPVIQDELALWAGRFNRLGADLTTAELEEQVFTRAKAWSDRRDRMLVPVRPYADYLGVRQRWRMFAAPNMAPGRFRIAVKEGGEWRPVYEARSTELDWNAHKLGQERVRVLVNRAAWPHHRAHYKRIAEWIADEAARDFPEATHVRLSYAYGKTPTPAQVRSGELPPVKDKRKLVRSLEERR